MVGGEWRGGWVTLARRIETRDTLAERERMRETRQWTRWKYAAKYFYLPRNENRKHPLSIPTTTHVPFVNRKIISRTYDGIRDDEGTAVGEERGAKSRRGYRFAVISNFPDDLFDKTKNTAAAHYKICLRWGCGVWTRSPHPVYTVHVNPSLALCHTMYTLPRIYIYILMYMYWRYFCI